MALYYLILSCIFTENTRINNNQVIYRAYILVTLKWMFLIVVGFDEGFGDGDRGCCRLFPYEQPDDGGGERRERASLDAAARPDDTPQHARNTHALGDPLRPRGRQPPDAGEITHARTNARTHTRTHTQTYTHTHNMRILMCTNIRTRAYPVVNSI